MPKIRKITPFFIDERGEMSHLLEENVSINSAILISCKKGAVRANHFHKKDNHYSIVLEGKMNYFYKDSKSSKIKKILVKKGYCVYTPAKEIHAMKFLEKSLFLALATEQREQDKYEDDTVKVKII